VALVIALLSAPLLYWLQTMLTHHADETALSMDALSPLTTMDPLTQLMNRRGITMNILEAMAQAARYNVPLSIAMVDVDGFQRVNDEFGHPAGDKVLAEVAGSMAEALRMPDKIGRFDGEEFLAVLPHTPLASARKIGERLRAVAAGTKPSVGGKRIALTVSVGVTLYAKGDDLEQLLSRSQAAVREAKRDDGNRVVAKNSSR
jgi:diguanylate cyclase (GGDEF)-like protein